MLSGQNASVLLDGRPGPYYARTSVAFASPPDSQVSFVRSTHSLALSMLPYQPSPHPHTHTYPLLTLIPPTPHPLTLPHSLSLRDPLAPSRTLDHPLSPPHTLSLFLSVSIARCRPSLLISHSTAGAG
jgi:hypothetical protein